MTLTPVALLAAIVLLLLLMGLAGALYALVYSPRAKLQRRITQLVGPARRHGKAGGGPGQRRKAIQGKLKDLEATRAKKRSALLRETLVQAGISLDVRSFIGCCVAAGLVGLGLAKLFGLPPAGVLAFPLLFGLGLPKLLLKILIGRRIKRFTSLFADAIDIIVRGIRSGLPVGECFNMIAREMPDPLGAEFRLIVEAVRLGLSLEDALAKAVERTPTAELRYFAIVLAIQQTTGGNLAETLAKLSEVLRGRKRMRDKIQAMSSEAKSSAGIIGSLPIVVTILLSVVAPDYIGILFTSSTGHLILFAGACVMGTGIFVMRQMIDFDI